MFSFTSLKPYQKGFTLIEVMVAVAVIAVALPALTMAMISQIDGTAYLRDKMLSHWVAENQLAEVRIKNRTTGLVPTTKQTGVEELAGRNWRWQVSSVKTEGEQFNDIYRLSVEVWRQSDGKDDPALVNLQGLIQVFKVEAIQRPKPAVFNSKGNNTPPANNDGQKGG